MVKNLIIGVMVAGAVGSTYFLWPSKPTTETFDESAIPSEKVERESNSADTSAEVATPDKNVKPENKTPETKSPTASGTATASGLKSYDDKYYQISLPSDWVYLGKGEIPMDYKFAFSISNAGFILQPKEKNTIPRTLNVEVFEGKQPLTLDDFKRQYVNWLSLALNFTDKNTRETTISIDGRRGYKILFNPDETEATESIYFFTVDNNGRGYLISAVAFGGDMKQFSDVVESIVAALKIK